MANILKKISIKTAVEVNDFKKFTETTRVLRLAGVVRKSVPGEHPQYGRFYKFLGNFVSIDLRTGKESVSSTAFLPSPVDELLNDAIGEGEGNIEFAFEISVKPRPDLQIGYEYLVDNLMETKRSDPLENLLKSLPAPQISHSGEIFQGQADREEPVVDADPALSHNKGKAKKAA